MPSSSPSLVRTARSVAATHWHLIAVIAAFFLSLLAIPVFADVPATDDWVYARSVEILIEESELRIFDLSVVTLVFQIVWGAYFALTFGPLTDSIFGALRLSTIVLIALSIPAVYGICRQLGADRAKSALGAAVYAFNPLTYSLGFTFMSDPQFSALMVISTWLYVKGLDRDKLDGRAILWGSTFAALAFLVRQQGLLIPFAVGIYLVASRRWWFNRDGLVLAGRVAAIPALTLVGYGLWLTQIHGVPEQQGQFVDRIMEAGLDDSRLLIGRLIFIIIAYIGLFVLPLTLSSFVSLQRWRLPRTRSGVIFFIVWSTILVLGALIFFNEGRVMPYIQQFWGLHGVGPTDIVGGRPLAISPRWAKPITLACLGSAALFSLMVAQRMGQRPSAERASVSLFVTIGLFQVFGVLPPSYHFRDWIISVDRYLLPVVPFAVGLAIWAMRDVSINTVRAWGLVALMAVFSVIATRDFIVFEDATWRVARQAANAGVPLTKLDAGPSWDGYHLYEDALAQGIVQTTPGGPWWTYLFAPSTDSTYVVASKPADGYVVVDEHEYSSWLLGDPPKLYLMRRETIPGPR
ncbi:MAG: hypothetical protein AVDCRST_MAG43-1475 [uncultured Thermomicrobiales bacterium]|uniref:Glycosyltransferase RgtA/B/C/D-like domain-containing protein n=1 Tax=uncultured Thermomicrobiales bacterium TaxID=1645740 RepID=A0A6J4UTP9_9BACT|nr:MAG: hypothetical protein AVDCRST_MAG43-1475 [uncultured Thermomicrobiales bacterium]